MVSKISLTLNQIIGADLFLGYHISNWNPRINYFLIGRYRYSNIFNVHHSYFLIKKFSTIILDLLIKKSRLWLVNENFPFFKQSPELSKLASSFPELTFYNEKWLKGTLSNYKFVLCVKPKKFPHAIFVPNLQNNHFVVNESYAVKIPSFGIIDSIDNPLNIFLPLPGNSKSVKSLYFFYIFISKLVLYSRYIISSSFVFSLYNKVKTKFRFRNKKLIKQVLLKKRRRLGLLKLQSQYIAGGKRIVKKRIKSLVKTSKSFNSLRGVFFRMYLTNAVQSFLFSEIVFILGSKRNRSRLLKHSKMMENIKFKIDTLIKDSSVIESFFRWRTLFIFFLTYFTNIFKFSFFNLFTKKVFYKSRVSSTVKTVYLILR